MAPTPALTSHPFQTSSGKPYTYLSAGPSNGPLIIFLHGWPGIALTWKPQLLTLSGLGFHCVAPDMPGYGGTWTSKEPSDFALEKLVPDFLDLLKHLGHDKAIWIGHDWGCGPLWAIASHHPEVCRAVVGISVPYWTLELGLEHLVTMVDRERYPEKEFPYGQWDYQVFYEQHPRAVDEQFENSGKMVQYIKMCFGRGSEATGKGIARTVRFLVTTLADLTD
jgi:soluble epoxide hydrolase / lipid-phosphate phosphatase